MGRPYPPGHRLFRRDHPPFGRTQLSPPIGREALSPEREPLDVLDALKLQIGSDAFSAQYQQAPAPPGGAGVKREWIVRYKEPPTISDRLMTLQSWDTASKGGPENDWSRRDLARSGAERTRFGDRRRKATGR
jgi:hypothetical protein